MKIEFETVEIKVTKPWLTYDAPRWLRVIEYFIRVNVFRQRPYMIDIWTIVSVEDGNNIAFHPDLVEHITEQLTKENENENIKKKTKAFN